MKTFEGKLVSENIRIGIVAGRFNEFITSKLLSGALDGLLRHNVKEDDIHIAWVPGAFEIPLIASKMAESGRYDAVICLGAVIRGNTSHYDYVCSEVSKGGVEPDEVTEFLKSLGDYPHIRVRGLMSVLPNLGDTPELRALYARLRELFESTKALSLPGYRADILSAGMSGDYKIALEYGSDMIRLGRTLFGERIYPASAVTDGAR